MTTIDPRPAVWTGHLVVSGKDLAASASFYEAIGMRKVAVLDEVAIFELRGGTHLVVRKDPNPKPGPGELGPHGRRHRRHSCRLDQQGPHSLADRERPDPRGFHHHRSRRQHDQGEQLPRRRTRVAPAPGVAREAGDSGGSTGYSGVAVHHVAPPLDSAWSAVAELEAEGWSAPNR